MPTDLKYRQSPHDSRRTGHPMLLGMIIGLLLGIVISLAVAMWLNRLSNPFVEKAKPIEPLAKIGPIQALKPEEKAGPGGTAEARADAQKPNADRPRFEFYTMLPGERQVADRETRAAPAKPKEAARSSPGTSPEQIATSSVETCWLQAGAFAAETDAENLKAKIAFTGLEASVKAVELPGKGTVHRVRLGPYQSMNNMNQIKAVLSQNGISTATICAAEAKQP